MGGRVLPNGAELSNQADSDLAVMDLFALWRSRKQAHRAVAAIHAGLSADDKSDTYRTGDDRVADGIGHDWADQW